MRDIILAFVFLATGRTNAKIQNSILSQYINGQTLEIPVSPSSILRLGKRGDRISSSIASSSRPISPLPNLQEVSPPSRQNVPSSPFRLKAGPPRGENVGKQVVLIEQREKQSVAKQAQISPQSSRPSRVVTPVTSPQRAPSPPFEQAPQPQQASRSSLERPPSPSLQRAQSPVPERQPTPPRRAPSSSPKRSPTPILQQSQSPSASQQRMIIKESETSRFIDPVLAGQNRPVSQRHSQSGVKDPPDRAFDSSSTASILGASASQKQHSPERLTRPTTSQDLGNLPSDSRFSSPARQRISQHARSALPLLLERPSQDGSQEAFPPLTSSAKGSSGIAKEGRQSPSLRPHNASPSQNPKNPINNPSSLQEPPNEAPANRADSPSSRQRSRSGESGNNAQIAQEQQNGATPQTPNSVRDRRLISWGRSYAFAKAQPYRCAAYILGVCSAGMLGAAVGIGNDPAHLVDHHLAVATAVGVPGLLTGMVAAGLARHEDFRDHIAATAMTDEQARNTLPRPLTAVISRVPALGPLPRPLSRPNLLRPASSADSSVTPSPQRSQTLGGIPLTSPATGNSPPIAILPPGTAITFPADTFIARTDQRQQTAPGAPQESRPAQSSTPSSAKTFADICKNAWEKTCENMYSAVVKAAKTVMPKNEPEPTNLVR